MRGFFSAEEIAEVATAQDAFYQGGFDSEPEFRWPLPRPCNARSRKHPYASFFLSPLAKLLRDGRLAKLVKESLGTPSIRFWHDQLLYEEPKPSAPLDYHWHREKSRWLTCAASQMATAWIPLTEFTHEMGPITIVPSGKEHPAMKRMVLRAGDLVIFPADTLHGNPPKLWRQPPASRRRSFRFRRSPLPKSREIQTRQRTRRERKRWASRFHRRASLPTLGMVESRLLRTNLLFAIEGLRQTHPTSIPVQKPLN